MSLIVGGRVAHWVRLRGGKKNCPREVRERRRREALRSGPKLSNEAKKSREGDGAKNVCVGG